MNILQAQQSAAGFFLASRRCFEERTLPAEQIQMLLIPGIVCSLFSIELGLKALILAKGGRASGHNLAALFNRVDPVFQEQIIKAAKLERTAFVGELAAISDGFTQWRYIHEHMNARINPARLDRLAHAVQTTVATAIRN